MAEIKKSTVKIITFIFIMNIIFSVDLFSLGESEKNITIVALNDFHGKLAEGIGDNKDPGISKVMWAVERYKQRNPSTIVVSAGDNYQGSAISNITHGEAVSQMFKEMGVQVSAVGNHEFDWGTGWIGRWGEEGGFQFLSANIINKKTGEIPTWAKPYYVVEVEGVKIGFLGLTTRETEYKTLPKNIENYEFLPLRETAEKWVKEMRGGEGGTEEIDVIIALTHIGAFQNKETGKIEGEIMESGILEVEGIDAIITGHSHEYVQGSVNGIPVIQGGKNGRALGCLNIKLDMNGKVRGIDCKVDHIWKDKKTLKEDPKGKKIYNKYERELGPVLEEVLGKTKEPLSHERFTLEGTSVLGKFLSDVMIEKSDAVIAFTNEGGIRNGICKGDITMEMLYNVMPFDNALITMNITGKELMNVIENGIMNELTGCIEISGCKVYYDPKKIQGNRVVYITLDNGERIQENKEYKIATNEFMYLGGDNYNFKGARGVRDTNKNVRDVLAEYIREKKNIDYKFSQPLIMIKE